MGAPIDLRLFGTTGLSVSRLGVGPTALGRPAESRRGIFPIGR